MFVFTKVVHEFPWRRLVILKIMLLYIRKPLVKGKCTPVVKTFPLFIMLATGQRLSCNPGLKAWRERERGRQQATAHLNQ